MLSANSGLFSPKKSAAAPQAAKVTFMKSGERPIMPQVERAQFSIIRLRASSPSRVVGLSKERPTGSPLVGEPDLALLFLEAVDVLLSRARRHAVLLGRGRC